MREVLIPDMRGKRSNQFYYTPDPDSLVLIPDMRGKRSNSKEQRYEHCGSCLNPRYAGQALEQDRDGNPVGRQTVLIPDMRGKR